jgi:hypothetical protein
MLGIFDSFLFIFYKNTKVTCNTLFYVLQMALLIFMFRGAQKEDSIIPVCPSEIIAYLDTAVTSFGNYYIHFITRLLILQVISTKRMPREDSNSCTLEFPQYHLFVLSPFVHKNPVNPCGSGISDMSSISGSRVPKMNNDVLALLEMVLSFGQIMVVFVTISPRDLFVAKRI